MPFGNGKLRTMNTRIIPQRKFNDRSITPLKNTRRAVSVLQTQDSFVSENFSDEEEVKDNTIKPTFDLKKEIDLTIENTDEIHTPRRQIFRQESSFKLYKFMRCPAKLEEKEFSELDDESDYMSSDSLSQNNKRSWESYFGNQPVLTLPKNRNDNEKVFRSPAKSPVNYRKASLAVNYNEHSEYRAHSSSCRKQKELDYSSDRLEEEERLRSRPTNVLNKL